MESRSVSEVHVLGSDMDATNFRTLVRTSNAQQSTLRPCSDDTCVHGSKVGLVRKFGDLRIPEMVGILKSPGLSRSSKLPKVLNA
jgi:hypothetical protein